MTFPIEILWPFLAAMLISSIGFKNYVWFISLGYGFSIAGESLLMLLLRGKGISAGVALCCALLIAYGLRLGEYLAFREFKVSSYKQNIKGEIKKGKSVPFGVKIVIWITVLLGYMSIISTQVHFICQCLISVS